MKPSVGPCQISIAQFLTPVSFIKLPGMLSAAVRRYGSTISACYGIRGSVLNWGLGHIKPTVFNCKDTTNMQFWGLKQGFGDSPRNIK